MRSVKILRLLPLCTPTMRSERSSLLKEIATVCREKGVLFHTDAVQAMGHVKMNVHAQGIDMLSLSGHKIHAQKGIGALYVRKGIPVTNLIFGGAQEKETDVPEQKISPQSPDLQKAMEIASTDIEKRAEKQQNSVTDLLKVFLSFPYPIKR